MRRAAADVGDLGAGAEFVFYSVERRDPRWHQVGDVAGPEELLASEEYVLVMLVPPYAGAGTEVLTSNQVSVNESNPT
jgi:hypothetical protein